MAHHFGQSARSTRRNYTSKRVNRQSEVSLGGNLDRTTPRTGRFGEVRQSGTAAATDVGTGLIGPAIPGSRRTRANAVPTHFGSGDEPTPHSPARLRPLAARRGLRPGRAPAGTLRGRSERPPGRPPAGRPGPTRRADGRGPRAGHDPA